MTFKGIGPLFDYFLVVNEIFIVTRAISMNIALNRHGQHAVWNRPGEETNAPGLDRFDVQGLEGWGNIYCE